jgi:hypothetical protein
VAAKYDSSTKRGPGRPRTQQETADLVVKVATENVGYVKLKVMWSSVDSVVAWP